MTYGIIGYQHLTRFLSAFQSIAGHIQFDMPGISQGISFNTIDELNKNLNIIHTKYPNFPYRNQPIESIEFRMNRFKLDEPTSGDPYCLVLDFQGESTYLHAGPPYKLLIEVRGLIKLWDFFEKF